MYRRSRKNFNNVKVIHRITSETIRLNEMELKCNNKLKNTEISSLQQNRKNPPGSSFQITSVCLTGKFDTGDDSADDFDESRTDDVSSRLDNETPSFSEDTVSHDGDELYHLQSSNNSKTNVTIFNNTTSDASASAEGKSVGNRFKVVKIESVTPFHRGRWKCLDYIDNSKHIPSDGWIYCDDQYVKLSEIQVASSTTTSQTTTTTPSKTESLIYNCLRPNNSSVTSTYESFQRQFSAPEPGYSIYPTQQFFYRNPQQFVPAHQPQTLQAPLQWHCTPQQTVHQCSPIHQNSPVTGGVQELISSPQLVQKLGHQEPYLEPKVIAMVRRIKDEGMLISTPTATPLEFEKKIQNLKTSNPESNEVISNNSEVKTMETSVNSLQASDTISKIDPQLSLVTINEATLIKSVPYCSQTTHIPKACTKITSEFEKSTQVIDIRNMETVHHCPMISPPQGTLLANLPRLLPDLNLNDATLFAVYCFIKNFIGASGASTAAIDNKIEQAMDLVKDHLLYTVREEVEVLKERIAELVDRINQLELENGFLRANASPEVLCALNSGAAVKQGTTITQG